MTSALHATWVPQNTHVTRTKTHLRRSGVYGGMHLYVCVKYFVLIMWWLTIFNKCIFDVANVGRSLAFIWRDGFYKSRTKFYRTG